MIREELFSGLMAQLEKLNQKKELGNNLPPDWFEPGMMENLDQYYGEYLASEAKIILKTEVKGLRYENRTPRLNRLSVGDSVKILRDPENQYNPNNFTVVNELGENIGNLPAELCNALAPPIDAGVAEISDCRISYMEKILERSRYAQQGVLFLRIEIQLT